MDSILGFLIVRIGFGVYYTIYSYNYKETPKNPILIIKAPTLPCVAHPGACLFDFLDVPSSAKIQVGVSQLVDVSWSPSPTGPECRVAGRHWVLVCFSAAM